MTGLTKAQYAVGYFTEMGIGCRRDILAANYWYVQAAEQGDTRATQRIAAIRAASDGVDPAQAAVGQKTKKGMSEQLTWQTIGIMQLMELTEGGKTKRFGIF
jgi:TPR repeat protein